VSSFPVLSGPSVAVVGSRRVPASAAGLVAGLVASVAASGRALVSSCCRSGAPALVRSAAASAGVPCAVFSALPSGVAGRAAFAARAAALVRAVAAAGSGSALVVLVSGPCPSGVVPARSWRSGRPVSGSWSEAALGAGLGLPVLVFWCAPAEYRSVGGGSPVLPSWPGFSWVPAGGSGVWSSAWRLVPAAAPLLPLR
jgi:hypothetical protein